MHEQLGLAKSIYEGAHKFDEDCARNAHAQKGFNRVAMLYDDCAKKTVQLEAFFDHVHSEQCDDLDSECVIGVKGQRVFDWPP